MEYFTSEDVGNFFFIWTFLLKRDAWWPLSVRVHTKPGWRWALLGRGGETVSWITHPWATLSKVEVFQISSPLHTLGAWGPSRKDCPWTWGAWVWGSILILIQVRWPSLVTICKWKQTLKGKLKKRHCGTEDESQVRELALAKACKLIDTPLF